MNNKNLKNVIMQLRKVCQHPFLFHWPKDPRTREHVLGDELVTTSTRRWAEQGKKDLDLV